MRDMRDLSKIKLGIALPNVQDSYPSQFVDTFCQITKPNHLYLKPDGGGPIDAVRNSLILKAMAMDCTHIWMTDTDQVYPQGVLMRLLSHDVDIVAAKVHKRYPPYDPEDISDTFGTMHSTKGRDLSTGYANLLYVDGHVDWIHIGKDDIDEAFELSWPKSYLP